MKVEDFHWNTSVEYLINFSYNFAMVFNIKDNLEIFICNFWM